MYNNVTADGFAYTTKLAKFLLYTLSHFIPDEDEATKSPCEKRKEWFCCEMVVSIY